MSEYSPQPIQDSELLSRFIFSPMHITRKGEIKPSLFSHVHSKGCSIQRESLAKNDELSIFVTTFLNEKNDRGWIGVVTGRCNDVRNIRVGGDEERAVCVYDTANLENPSHGEMFQSQYIIEEADGPELREKLFEAFDKSNPIKPQEYRQGDIWSQLPRDLQERATSQIK